MARWSPQVTRKPDTTFADTVAGVSNDVAGSIQQGRQNRLKRDELELQNRREADAVARADRMENLQRDQLAASVRHQGEQDDINAAERGFYRPEALGQVNPTPGQTGHDPFADAVRGPLTQEEDAAYDTPGTPGSPGRTTEQVPDFDPVTGAPKGTRNRYGPGPAGYLGDVTMTDPVYKSGVSRAATVEAQRIKDADDSKTRAEKLADALQLEGVRQTGENSRNAATNKARLDAARVRGPAGGAQGGKPDPKAVAMSNLVRAQTDDTRAMLTADSKTDPDTDQPMNPTGMKADRMRLDSLTRRGDSLANVIAGGPPAKAAPAPALTPEVIATRTANAKKILAGAMAGDKALAQAWLAQHGGP